MGESTEKDQNRYSLDDLLLGVWQVESDDGFEWAAARVHNLVNRLVREAQAQAWDQGYDCGADGEWSPSHRALNNPYVPRFPPDESSPA